MPARLSALLLALLLWTAGPARAQERLGSAPGDSLVITFDEAVRLALERNPDIRRAALGRRTRGLAVESARLDVGYLPTVTGSVQPSQRYGLAFDQTTGQLVSETSESLNMGLSAQLNLYDGNRDRRLLEQARIEEQASRFDLERAQRVVVFDVAQRFLQLLLDRELVGIQRENLAAQRAQLARVEALIEAGVRARADLFSGRAALAERELALVEAEAAVETSTTRLVEILQLDPLGTYTFVAPDVSGASLAAESFPLDTLLAEALAQRPDLRAQALQIAAAEAGVRVARTGRRPTVDVFAEYGTGFSSLAQRLANPDAPPVLLPVTTVDGEPILVGGVPFTIPSGDTELEGTPFISQFGDNRGGSIGFNISVPIFDRYATRRAVQEAQLRVEEARIVEAGLRQGVAVEVRQALVDYRTALRRLEVTAVQVEAAQAALTAEQDRYELGSGTLVALADARARLVEAQAARAQAVFQFLFRRTLIAYTLGRLDPGAAVFE